MSTFTLLFLRNSDENEKEIPIRRTRGESSALKN